MFSMTRTKVQVDGVYQSLVRRYGCRAGNQWGRVAVFYLEQTC